MDRGTYLNMKEEGKTLNGLTKTHLIGKNTVLSKKQKEKTLQRV